MTNHTPNTLPCKCRLLRPDGTQRAYFRAADPQDAQRWALRILRKGALPKGWKLQVDRSATAPAPRLFQLRDRVERVGHETVAVPLGMRGTVIEIIQRDTPQTVRVQWDDGQVFRYGSPVDPISWLKFLEPAPQPKAEDLLAAAIKQSTEIAGQFQDAMQMPGASWPDLVARAKTLPAVCQEIATLKDVVDRATNSRDGWAMEAELWKTRHKGLEAKLADVAALHRTMTLAKASRTADWDFTTLLADVLDRKA